eukprot:PhM_4_TR2437/c5_g1_i1/m.50806
MSSQVVAPSSLQHHVPAPPPPPPQPEKSTTPTSFANSAVKGCRRTPSVRRYSRVTASASELSLSDPHPMRTSQQQHQMNQNQLGQRTTTTASIVTSSATGSSISSLTTTAPKRRELSSGVVPPLLGLGVVLEQERAKMLLRDHSDREVAPFAQCAPLDGFDFDAPTGVPLFSSGVIGSQSGAGATGCNNALANMNDVASPLEEYNTQLFTMLRNRKKGTPTTGRSPSKNQQPQPDFNRVVRAPSPPTHPGPMPGSAHGRPQKATTTQQSAPFSVTPQTARPTVPIAKPVPARPNAPSGVGLASTSMTGYGANAFWGNTSKPTSVQLAGANATLTDNRPATRQKQPREALDLFPTNETTATTNNKDNNTSLELHNTSGNTSIGDELFPPRPSRNNNNNSNSKEVVPAKKSHSND